MRRIAELLALRGVRKSYRRGERRLRVLIDVELEVRPREIVAVLGARNEGKTTLLQIAAGLQQPDQGEVWLGGIELSSCAEREREQLLGGEIAWIRREGPGLNFKVLEHVALPLVMGRRRTKREAQHGALEALERVGAPGCAGLQWGDLSNWERVLVALARGIAGGPRLLVVDDVIDGFGKTRTREAGELLLALAAELGCGVLMSASDPEAALFADREWRLERGGLKLSSGALGAGAEVIDLHEGARKVQGSRGAGS